LGYFKSRPKFGTDFPGKTCHGIQKEQKPQRHDRTKDIAKQQSCTQKAYQDPQRIVQSMQQSWKQYML